MVKLFKSIVGGALSAVFGSGSKGVATDIIGALIGRGRNQDPDALTAALAQYAAEFQGSNRSPFDRFMDAINRLPRPFMALGMIAIFVFAWVDPVAFVIRMEALGTVPESMWWLIMVIAAFYFGGRFQAKSIEQNSRAASAESFSNAIASLTSPYNDVKSVDVDVVREPDDDSTEPAPDRANDNPALEAMLNG